MNAQSLGWDDLRIVLAVARAGSLSGAARTLHVTHSTVFRRIGAIEKKLDVRLFERLQSGYTMTPAGEAMLRTGTRVEEEMHALERELTGRDTRLVGSLRVTTTDTLAFGLLAPSIAAFKERYPGISVELFIDSAFLSLTRRDADVAIRPTSRPPETLVGKRVCDIATAVFGSVEYRQHNRSRSLANHRWLLPDESLSQLASTRWAARQCGDETPALKCNSLLGLFEATRCDMGIAALPCFLGDSDPSLTRVQAPVAELGTQLWLLTHPDLRRTARVHAFMEFMLEDIRRHKDLLEGREARKKNTPKTAV